MPPAPAHRNLIALMPGRNCSDAGVPFLPERSQPAVGRPLDGRAKDETPPVCQMPDEEPNSTGMLHGSDG